MDRGERPAQSIQIDLMVPDIEFSAIPAGIAAGESATLAWNVTNADSVQIDQGIGAVNADDTMDVAPTTTTDYTLTATGPGGTVTRTITVWIDTRAPEIDTITPGSRHKRRDPERFFLMSPGHRQ